jgi:hypothetical protein
MLKFSTEKKKKNLTIFYFFGRKVSKECDEIFGNIYNLFEMESSKIINFHGT